ncbi:PH domain-containing protein [Auritidibacter ignavus]|uniref:PH domain-containing protein n=1 Tax=Auritidibacter ignavus TaxID=678932 RepID=UPI000F0279C5|nr:PH domain-containing protein [Auritidibacter ignavus]NIH72213.1 hypothetical protein [Auritidibacter ignavus]RMX23769.1 hypothetical protein DYI20_02835 [Auritidibacter ignavus]WGH87094.1 PH domain-containing protein [Auritidibacter ignavus]WGH89378.1 PH domain-containing protein [Auritidibacter ignavus]WGH91723.1 PH domain-containing protein [Auritidibacter ignavus]
MLFKTKKVALRDDLQNVLDTNKIKRNTKNKALLNDLLKDAETVEYALTCRKGKRFGVMVTTDQRLLWVSTIAGMPDVYTIDRSEITGLDSSTNSANLTTFTINQAGQKTVFDYGQKKAVVELVKQLS